jgi:hypothetical protein
MFVPRLGANDEVLLDPRRGGLVASLLLDYGPTPRTFAIGVVTMTKRPVDLLTWLRYHREHIGVCRYFIRVEDTPELSEVLCTSPWSDLVEATFASKTQAPLCFLPIPL